MKGFFSSLIVNLRSLPGNLRRGLRPGVHDVSDSAARRVRRNFVYHLHPLRVTERALHPLTTLGLGLITLTLFLLLCATGVLLMIYYVPSTKGAYASMEDIQFAVTFGPFVRALHRWAAHGMVVTVFLHLLRVMAMGAYRNRELNWLVGLGLGVLTLGLAFTGYLLPWDQLSFWAVGVAAAMLDNVPLLGGAAKTLALGGAQVGQATLLRFYMLHVALLPAGMVLLAAVHLWRIRRDGGLCRSLPDSGEEAVVPAWPHLVIREALLVLWVVAILFVVAAWIDAPLGIPVDLHMPSNPEKAPWYFLWAQEIVSYSAPVGVVAFPGLLLGWLLFLPFLDREDRGTGTWFAHRSCRRSVVISIVVAVACLFFFEAMFLGGGAAPEPGQAGSIRPDLLNPATGMIGLALLVTVVSGWMTGSTRAGLLSGLMVMFVAIVGFTLVGACRGPDWVFYWPWEEWPFVT